VVNDISHDGLRVLLREEGVTFSALESLKAPKIGDSAGAGCAG
jgi:hypothetical protein